MAGLALSGCFTSTADFQNDAEKFILEDEGVRNGVFPDDDIGFTSVACVKPENQNVGTKFMCDATAEDGQTWEFEVEILDSDEMSISVSGRP